MKTSLHENSRRQQGLTLVQTSQQITPPRIRFVGHTAGTPSPTSRRPRRLPPLPTEDRRPKPTIKEQRIF